MSLPPTTMEVQIEEIDVGKLRRWEINVWDIEALEPYVYSIFKDYDMFNRYEIPLSTFNKFVTKIQHLYNHRENPYHNWLHGFCVLQSVYVLLSSTPVGDVFSQLDILALLIAALCHDVDHSGKTNAFEVSSASELAITYHDAAVLENHHAATTFKIM